MQNNGYRKTTGVLFLLGCFGIMWHNADRANEFSIHSDKVKLYGETESFLEKYRELSQKAPVVPIYCPISRDFEIKASLCLSKLVDQSNLIYFYGTENLKKTLKIIPTPFYMLTKYKIEFLTREAKVTGLRVFPVLDGSYFDCSFYLIVNSGELDKESSS